MIDYLQIFIVAAFCAITLNVILKKFELPSIIGYILTGVIISQIYHLVIADELTHIAEFGIVFLMFSIGLEFIFKHLLAMKRDVFLNGTFEMLLCGIACSLVASAVFLLDDKTALIVGFALALSSTAVVLKILNDNGDISQTYGRKALGILLFQDIAVIPLLLLIDIFSSGNQNIAQIILTTLISAVILITLLFFIGKYLLNSMLRFVIRSSSQEIFILSVLFLVIGSSFLANYFGFSYSLGAFIAGVLIAETKYKHKIEADLVPFRDLLLGLFFITIGMQIDFKIVFENWLLILFITSVVVLIKFVLIFGFLSLFVRKKTALKTAFATAQIGEFALAIFSLLEGAKMLSKNASQILILVVVITMIATPFVLKNIRKISDKVSEMIDENAPKEEPKIKLSNHFVIFGYGRLGQEVVQKVKNTGIPYLVLESDLNLVELGVSRGENVYFANAAQVQTLQIANIEECAVVIITVSNETKLEMLCEILTSLKKPVDVIIHTNSSISTQFYSSINENLHIVSAEKVVSRFLVQEALECKISKHN